MGSSRRRRRRGGRRRRSDGQDGQEAPQQREGASRPARRLAGVRDAIDSFGGFLTIGAVAVAVVAVVALIALNRPGGGGGAAEGEFTPRERTAAIDGRVLGDPSAPVRIVAFEDFSCSHCGTFTHETEPLIEAEYVEAGLVSFEFRHMAILGPDSERAAAASECAAAQDLFWPYHDLLFRRQGMPNSGWASTGNLKDFARELNEALDGGGLDLDAFDECVDAGVQERLVRLATDEAGQLVVSLGGRPSTPAFLINGALRLQGAQPIEVFRREIDAALASAGADGG